MSLRSKPKVLLVCHNHPRIRPGGAEAYALDLYQAIRDAGEFDAVFLGRTGATSPTDGDPRLHPGTPLGSVAEDSDQYLLYTDIAAFDNLFQRSADKETITRDYADFLQAVRPDVVHFQHTLFIGCDFLRVTKNVLPEAPIVYTLHDFVPICHHYGQMVRTSGNKLCHKASPRRCHECFPHISAPSFFMRERFIKSHLALVDRFITPSHFLRERYAEWGIPAEKILFEDNGRLPGEPLAAPANGAAQRPRNRFAFFGQFTPFKGADVLLEAMAMLGEEFDGHLWIHGANLEVQATEFQDRLAPLLEETSEMVTVGGAYDRSQLAKLMAQVDWVIVPSIWWENAPLVIQEAFEYGCPVICSDIGGMAEKVTDGVDGLHFRRGDAEHLAETIRHAAETPGLWDRLRAGIPAGHAMDDHVARLSALYAELMSEATQAAATDRPTAVRGG